MLPPGMRFICGRPGFIDGNKRTAVVGGWFSLARNGVMSSPRLGALFSHD